MIILTVENIPSMVMDITDGEKSRNSRSAARTPLRLIASGCELTSYIEAIGEIWHPFWPDLRKETSHEPASPEFRHDRSSQR